MMMTMSLTFTGDTVQAIDREIEAYLAQRNGLAATAPPQEIAEIMRGKAATLASNLSDNPRRVLRTMVELHRQGKVPTPPLVMKELNVAKKDEQGARAWIGKVRAALEAADRAHGGPPILISAPVVDGHTRYQLDDRGAEAIADEFDGIAKAIDRLQDEKKE